MPNITEPQSWINMIGSGRTKRALKGLFFNDANENYCTKR